MQTPSNETKILETLDQMKQTIRHTIIQTKEKWEKYVAPHLKEQNQ